ncbi:MAG TPA: glycerophosphodiester phosphodiesterase family protein [Pyrinomonadaceae bacterium]|jgi:glycerophosphoryl diester phosphodiesterase
MSRPLIIGHRGASAHAPENTLIAFERALAAGADGIEFDVRLARDQVPVVIHDADLRRTAHSAGLIADLSSTELAQVDVGTWFNLRHTGLASVEFSRARVPTLAQVFELFGSSFKHLYVEMKCVPTEAQALAAEVAALTRADSLTERVVIESFNLEAISELKRLAPEIRTAALFEPKLSRPLPGARRIFEQAALCGADEIALHRALVSRRLAAEATRRGLKTVVWTVDHPAWIERARQLSLHALITNRPALMLAHLGPLESQSV